ncbi:EF-hand domain protein [Cryptosporidium meleagridis]|uniref:EF-hand domain protein n=1 Tax=Cryptosporidium meleagridis TaxID=93969 RepID=A0A2P4Z2N4_9CRYT|nr:EF-hand domain protein [Cryptosporidium meleagridis]
MRRNNPDHKTPDSDHKELRSSKDSVFIYEDECERESNQENENNKVNHSEKSRSIDKGSKIKVDLGNKKINGRKYDGEVRIKNLKEDREPGQGSLSNDESAHLLKKEQHEQKIDIQNKADNELFQNLKKEAVNSFLEVKQDLLEQYLEFRNQVLKGQKSFRVLSQVATANLFLMGTLNCIFGLISINLLAIVISLYIISISSAVLIIEVSRKKRIKHIEIFVRTWFKFLELSVGRGFIQILLCTISLYLTQSTYFSLMSLFVGLTGLLNIIFGILAASKLRKILNILKYYGSRDLEDLGIYNKNEISHSELENIKVRKDQDPEYKLKKIHRFFNALDEDGNGQINQDELFDGLKSLNFPFTISRTEIEIIFDHLDKDSNNMISIEDFENWFISNKCPYFIL